MLCRDILYIKKSLTNLGLVRLFALLGIRKEFNISEHYADKFIRAHTDKKKKFLLLRIRR